MDLRNLSRFELKRVIETLGERCGNDVVRGAVTSIVGSKTLETVTGDGTAEKNVLDTGNSVEPDANVSKSDMKRKADDVQELVETKKVKIGKKGKKARKPFDMEYFAQRQIALHVTYFGEYYRGFALQDNNDRTVEHQIFQALSKAKLITDPAKCGYSRCGRTDAGVSAMGQIISLCVRSALTQPLPAEASKPATKTREFTGKGLPKQAQGVTDADEIDYPYILNKILPDDILVLGWAPCPSLSFKARFNAESRTYRYYFLRRDLDLNKMREAAKMLEGTHDFRNLCKMDVLNVKNFIRRINEVEVAEMEDPEMCYFRVNGSAFLYNQIRHIAQVLFLVGRRLEEPDIVPYLLDVENNPRKPMYDIAAGEPLNLFESEYPDLSFKYSGRNLSMLRERLDRRYAQFKIKSTMTKQVVDYMSNLQVYGEGKKFAESDHHERYEGDFFNKRSNWRKGYVSLKSRNTQESYEERVDKLSKERKAKVKLYHGWDI
uniref:tRNA pseudouridine synthase n=1 Tax=Mucochytrium quahogii TaxID=96639 RepID=A0A7S2S488_9STRA|mmetsp:Transcript_32738/g.52232  ORF Transcript_32738/g.52232 Transcript_32738/m.52232 type:complete len:490 (-) Transcript_32738:836-2305(-)|eukprot:CAMPEP_0203748426 /NCGR_PEP_ID=MMETSP0098-20131031/3314_1 /ASSEMBLY_ACC=CAM_ASM_000208 /TAXON_ID=96639 /ORGANISM=" , Strain NY0313808BC1" /LENGTH=489 /DNA_ID=CAMNT_0050637167 /DNA_START=390 /DNA_END=1859 /DNA_ORIENTATION=-